MLNRFSYIFLLALFTLCAFLYINYSRQQELPPARFTGTDRCAVCHGTARIGAQTQRWQQSAHAAAYTRLSSDTARAYLAAHGLSTDGCLSCHSTLGRAAGNDAEKKVLAEGVGCERCHGPGSNYSEYNIMLDRAAFTSRGGVVGSKSDCAQCHAANPATDSPHCPFQTKPFNPDSAWKIIGHALAGDSARVDSATRITFH